MRKYLNILKQFKNNYLVVQRFLKETKNCKVIFFSVPANEFFVLQTYDIFESISQQITRYKEGTATPYERRKTLKLAWLTTLNKFYHPVQVLKHDDRYFVHPGTDRIAVSLYLKPKKYIEGLYIWYPDLDPHPEILDYYYEFLVTPLEVLSKFKLSSSLKFKTVRMNNNLDTSDAEMYETESNAMFDTAKKCFEKTSKNFDYTFLSWHDNMQWSEIEKYKDTDLINFEKDLCNFGGVRLTRKKNKWVKE